jgi:hypothetical protein
MEPVLLVLVLLVERDYSSSVCALQPTHFITSRTSTSTGAVLVPVPVLVLVVLVLVPLSVPVVLAGLVLGTSTTGSTR